MSISFDEWNKLREVIQELGSADSRIKLHRAINAEMDSKKIPRCSSCGKPLDLWAGYVKVITHNKASLRYHEKCFRAALGPKK